MSTKKPAKTTKSAKAPKKAKVTKPAKTTKPAKPVKASTPKQTSVDDIPLHKDLVAPKTKNDEKAAVDVKAIPRHRQQKASKAVKRARTFGRHEIIMGLVVGFFLVIFICLASLVVVNGDIGLFRRDAGKKPASTSSPSPSPNPAKSPTPPASADEKSFETKINSWYASAGDEVFKPDAGNQFVIVNVSVTHHIKDGAWLAPVVQSYLIDTSGNTYGMAPTASDSPLKAGHYKANETATGELSYQLPLTVGDVQWCYRLDAANDTPQCKSLLDVEPSTPAN